jgi:hypothetical protein
MTWINGTRSKSSSVSAKYQPTRCHPILISRNPRQAAASDEAVSEIERRQNRLVIPIWLASAAIATRSEPRGSDGD